MWFPGRYRRYRRRDERATESGAIDKIDDESETLGRSGIRQSGGEQCAANDNGDDDGDDDDDDNGDGDNNDDIVRTAAAAAATAAAAGLSHSRGCVAASEYRRKWQRNWQRKWQRKWQRRCWRRQRWQWLSRFRGTYDRAGFGATFSGERRSGEGAKPLRQILGKRK